jgi:hypothetical protein
MYFVGVVFVGDGYHYQGNKKDSAPQMPIWIFNG